MLQTTNRLPGISFLTEAPQVREALPRMDIAAFVGFATAGPVDTPVPIEDTARFREIFREDVRLAWDTERGEPQYSYLGQAVESFFRNGGVRCWVVRVAGKEVQVARFRLPCVIQTKSEAPLFNPDGQFKEAVISARSPGIWAEEMLVSTILSCDSFLLNVPDASESRPCPLDTIDDAYQIKLRSTPAGLQKEDLLRITFPPHGPILFLFINNIQHNNGSLIVSGKAAFWFVYESTASPPVSPMVAEEDTGENLVPISQTEGYDLYRDWSNTSPPISGIQVDRLRFEILVWRRGKLDQRFGNLAFSKQHPRFWAKLPSDDDLFELTEGRKSKHFGPETERLRQQANSPRFDLAGPDNEDLPDYYLPINMPETVDDSFKTASVQETKKNLSSHERNGINLFDADLFIDKDLKHVGSGMLLQEANHKYYIRQDTLCGIHSLLPVDEVTLIAVPDAIHRPWSLDAEPVPAPLEAPILELVLGPDTFNRYTLIWSKVPAATRYLVQRADTPDFLEPTNHVVERPLIQKYEQPYPSDTKPDTELKIMMPFQCARSQYFRVRSERYGEISPWSNTRGKILPHQDFSHCETPQPDSLELDLKLTWIGSPDDRCMLMWDPVENGSPGREIEIIDEYELQRASDKGFFSAQRVDLDHSSADHIMLPVQHDTVTYYRVRAWSSNTAGPWSNTVCISPRFLSAHTLKPIKDYDGQLLRTVHGALMRFCAARGDIFSVLSLPRHYRYQDVIDHVQALKATGNASSATIKFDSNELRYGALYHPWLASNAESQQNNGTRSSGIRFNPPDGAITGAMASLAITHGVWLAPANQPLLGILALDPDFTIEQWNKLTTSQINIIRQDPRGFMVLNTDTLSTQNEFRMINVRRLLSLLRRLALREGNIHVFESNDSEFRDAMQHHFEQVLSDLYVRGAFAGTHADAAYRVITDSSVNSWVDIDRGRFIVELQVAPSKPLSFINIRLLQTAPGQLEVQEF